MGATQEEVIPTIEPDKYDRAIAYLRDHPVQIYDAWNNTGFHPAGCLFSRLGKGYNQMEFPDGQVQKEIDGRKFEMGCLTQIKTTYDDFGYQYIGPTPEITQEILNDSRVPFSPPRPFEGPNTITVDHLELFAYYQRRIDKEFNRE